MNNQNKEKFSLRISGKILVIVDWANVHGWHKTLKWKIDPKRLFQYIKTYPNVIEQRFYHGVDENKEWSVEIKKKAEDIGFAVVSKDVKWTPVYLNKQNHFKIVIQKLFNVLDGIKTANSDIATKLYELREKIESRLAERKSDIDSSGSVQGEYPPYAPEDQKVYDSAYELIEELDSGVKKINLNIDELQQQLFEPVKRRKCDFDVEIARDVFNLSNYFESMVLFSGDGDYAALVEDLTINKGKKVIVVFAPGHKGKEYEKITEQLQEKELNYRLFLCSVKQLKNYICEENNIPADFSAGRDKDIIP